MRKHTEDAAPVLRNRLFGDTRQTFQKLLENDAFLNVEMLPMNITSINDLSGLRRF